MLKRFCFGLIFCVPLFAAPVPPQGASVERGLPPPEATKGGLKLDLYGWTYTNSFTRWNGRKASADGSAGSPMQITNQLILHYPAFGNMDFTFVPQFNLQPWQGERFQLLNPTVGMQGTLVESGGFSYWARYEVVLPLLDASRRDGMIAAPQVINTVAYQFPHSQFKLEATLVPSVTLYNNGQASSFLYASPRLYYLLNDSWWLLGIVETTWSTKRGGPSLLEITQDGPPNAGVGFRYTAQNGKGLYVQPYLDFYPQGRVLESAHIGVIFGGPLL